jgi:hypothetical protein
MREPASRRRAPDTVSPTLSLSSGPTGSRDIPGRRRGHAVGEGSAGLQTASRRVAANLYELAQVTKFWTRDNVIKY